MKTDTHPTYFTDATITCACGTVIKTGSTKQALKTELCSACHPFFTGKQNLIDTAGRIDKFKAKRLLADAKKEETKNRAESKKKKNVYVEKEVPAEILARSSK